MLADAAHAGRGARRARAGVTRGAARRAPGRDRRSARAPLERVDALRERVESADREPRGQGARARSAPPALHRVERAHRGRSSTTSARRSARSRTRIRDASTLSPQLERRRASVARAGEPSRASSRPLDVRRRSSPRARASASTALDERVATVATEIARAKTLWPVALRSLEARLDDAASATRPRRAEATARTTATPPSTRTETTPTTSSRACATACRRWRPSPRRWRALRRAGPADDELDADDDARRPWPAGARVVPLRAERARRPPIDAAAARHPPPRARPATARGRAAGWSTARSPCSRAPERPLRRAASSAPTTKYAIRIASTYSSPRA